MGFVAARHSLLKRCVSVGLAAAALVPVAFLAAQQPARDAPARKPLPAGTALIAGSVVTDEAIPQPVRRARLTLNDVERAIPGRTITTDDRGRFAFRDLPAGRFELQAAKPGYLSVNHGAKRLGRPGTPISVADGARIVDLVLRIPRCGVITGTVRDQGGQPVPGVGVNILRYGYSAASGGRMLSVPASSSSASTDDRGMYRAWGLPPGEYVVVATPGPDQRVPGGAQLGRGVEDIYRVQPGDALKALALVQGRTTGPGLATPGRGEPQLPPRSAPVNYAPVFYPGTANLANASTIALNAAEERAGIDIQIQLVATARIEGTCALPPGVQPQTIAVSLEFTGTPVEIQQGIGVPRPATARLTPDGRFLFAGVTPGHYTITAKTAEAGSPGRAGPAPPQRQATSDPVWWALTEVDVDGQDLFAPLELQPAMTIAGRVVFEGAMQRPQDYTGLRGFLVPRNAGGNLGAGPPGGQIDKDGRFMFSGVTPGSYRIFWTGSDRVSPWSLKSAVALGVDMLDGPLEIKPGMTTIDLTVTYTDRPTAISGTLQDTTGRPAADYFIMVFPANRALWGPRTRRVQTVRPATDGAYRVVLPAGDYFIAALIDVESGDTSDPSFLDQLVPESIRVSVADGESATRDIRIRK